MNMLRRIVGLFLVVIAAVVAVHMIVEPLYHASSEGDPYSPIWNTINPFMALAVVLGVVFATIRKRGIDREGGGAAVTREFSGCQHAILRFPVGWHPVLLELVQPPESRFYRRRDGCNHLGVGAHRRRAAAALGRHGPVSAERRQVSKASGTGRQPPLIVFSGRAASLCRE